MTEKLSGIITDAILVTFTGLPDHLPPCRRLTGIVRQDFKGRFDAGNAIVTSLVEFADGDVVKTLNSIYQIEGPLEHMDLPWQAYLLVRDFVDPRVIRLQIDIMKNRGELPHE